MANPEATAVPAPVLEPPRLLAMLPLNAYRPPGR